MQTQGTVRILLRLEGLVMLGLSSAIYSMYVGDWKIYFTGFFLPDISLFGYLFNSRIGAIFYNLGHSYIGPELLLSLWIGFKSPLLQISLIWFAHIGFDRFLGFGLKYSNGFGFAHLKRIGKIGNNTTEKSFHV